MSFMAKTPIIMPEISSSPTKPPNGTRGFFATKNGLKEIDSEGNIYNLSGGGTTVIEGGNFIVTSKLYNDISQDAYGAIGSYHIYGEISAPYSQIKDAYDKGINVVMIAECSFLSNMPTVLFRLNGMENGKIRFQTNTIFYEYPVMLVVEMNEDSVNQVQGEMFFFVQPREMSSRLSGYYTKEETDIRSGQRNPIDAATVKNIFRCAMTYVNHSDELIFTSSGEGTLFDDDFSSDNPLMDCSSMMMAWVQGIPYEYSKYAGANNIRHYGYGITLPPNPYAPDRPGRYYTHELAHYFDEKGYCFRPNADYSDIAPGDVIFVSFKSREGSEFHDNAYMKIDHCLLVIGFKDKTHLTCLHTSETKTFNFYDVCVAASEYDSASKNSYNDAIVLVARLPYNQVGSISGLPIIKDSTERTTIDTSGHLKTLTLDEPLKKNTAYTLVTQIENAFPQEKPSNTNYAGIRASFKSGTADKTIVSWQGNKNPDDNTYYFRFIVGDDQITALKIYILTNSAKGHKYKFAQLYEGLVFPNLSEDDTETGLNNYATKKQLENAVFGIEASLENIISKYGLGGETE